MIKLETKQDIERAEILLKAAYNILKQCEDSFYVLNVLGVTAEWDGVECDGACLLNDINDLLEIDEERI